MSETAAPTRDCLGCGTTFVMHHSRPTRTYCSSECRLRKHHEQRRKEAAAPSLCLYCGEPYQPKRTEKFSEYCTKECSRLAWRLREAEAGHTPSMGRPDLESPLEWDGKTTTFDRATLTYTFELSCMWCGWLDYRHMTNREFAALKPQRCQRCGARCWVDRADIGSMGSPRTQAS